MTEEVGLYKFTIKLLDIKEPDDIIIFGMKNCVLYYGHINKDRNTIIFNYHNWIYRHTQPGWLKEKDIEFFVFGKKQYNFEIINKEKITNTRKFILIGDSHSYYHKDIITYMSYAQYIPFFLKDNIEFINFSQSGKSLNWHTHILHKFEAVYPTDNDIIFIMDGANTLRDQKQDDISIDLGILCRYWPQGKKYLCRQYPFTRYDDGVIKIKPRCLELEDLYKQGCLENNIKYFNIDQPVINFFKIHKFYELNAFSRDIEDIQKHHTNALGALIIMNILKIYFRKWDLMNSNNITFGDYKIIRKIIHKYSNTIHPEILYDKVSNISHIKETIKKNYF